MLAATVVTPVAAAGEDPLMKRPATLRPAFTHPPSRCPRRNLAPWSGPTVDREHPSWRGGASPPAIRHPYGSHRGTVAVPLRHTLGLPRAVGPLPPTVPEITGTPRPTGAGAPGEVMAAGGHTLTALVIMTFTPVGNSLGSPWMRPREEPPLRAEAGYWSTMFEKAGVQVRGVRPLP
jgi:hypothetical protein